MQQNQYHHYIPRFLLRNFAINIYERIFVSNEKLLKSIEKKKYKQSFKNKNKLEALLQTYDRTLGKLNTSLTGKTYGYTNMYKDFDDKDVMRVEKKLATLEMQASKVIHDILRASQKENQVVLLSVELNNLYKFLFIMDYRKPHRWSQFINGNFDAGTLPIVKEFMQEYKLQSTREVWLQNIREILDTEHNKIKDNLRILKPDRDDYVNRMMDRFLVIWQAGENDEFITTSNGFGIFEGMNEILNVPVPQFQFQYAYHYFYVISPKLVLVLCTVFFRKELSKVMPSLIKKYPSIFENVPRPPVPKCVKLSKEDGHSIDESSFTPLDFLLNSQGYKTEESEKYTFPFVRVTSATVHKVNTVLLNETKPDLVLTFLSHSFLYKTIVKYHKNRDFNINHDFSSLKKNLFIALNRTHEENLKLRSNIPAGHVCNWNVCVMGSEPN
ncbi:hypothetical protein Glove_248g33 [Diversispora epigaea]|uniref:DUF4238 domain-containing protein n=1 Tax=Diversispora epigaea TaxID=1348612 RepID=A0A397IF02_9GLOM|nr:hypothetical protein Glove_248g33 [Diversispora epigaea]